MDPSSVMSLIQAALQAAKWIFDASQSLKENREECKKFSEHAKQVLTLLSNESGHTSGPKLAAQVERLCE